MSTAILPRRVAKRGVSRALAVTGVTLAAAAVLLLAAGPLGWRAGWWSYRTGLLTLMPAAGYVAIAAVAVCLLALVVGARSAPPRLILLALLGIAIGGAAAYFPWHWYSMSGRYPRMNDATTDVDNPPSLAFSEAPRQAEDGIPASYDGAAVAAIQRKFYPDIKPALLDLPPAQAFERALSLARTKGWTIVKSNPAAGVIDAYDRSFWFGFTDDIAIRVTPSGEGSRVDIRSHARHGRGDFGVNAARVRGFLAALQPQP